MKKMFFVWLIILLSACSTSMPKDTLYQPRNDDGVGYSQQSLGGHRYRVVFDSASATAWHEMESYLLYRVSELASQQGYRYVEIGDIDRSSSVQRQRLPEEESSYLSTNDDSGAQQYFQVPARQVTTERRRVVVSAEFLATAKSSAAILSVDEILRQRANGYLSD